MELLVIFFYLFITITTLIYSFKNNEILHPLVLFYLPLTLSLIFYIVFYRKDHLVTNKTLFIYLIGGAGFLSGYILMSAIHSLRNKEINKGQVKVLRVNKYLKSLYSTIGITGFMLSFLTFIKFGLNGVGSNFFVNVRYNTVYGAGYSSFETYSTVFLYFRACLAIYEYNSPIRKQTNHKFFTGILILMSLMSGLFKMERTSIVLYFFSYVYIYIHFINIRIKNKVSKSIYKQTNRKTNRRFGLLLLSIIILFTWMAKLTNKIGELGIANKNFFIYKYLGYPIVAFDKHIIDYPSITKGYFTLGPFGKVFKKLSSYEVVYQNSIKVIPGEFNVFSYLRDPYLDYGSLGVFLVMVIIGVWVGYIYKSAKKNGGWWAIFYSAYIYPIIMSFFAYQYSNTFYIYLGILILLTKIMSKKPFSLNNEKTMF